MVIEQEETHNGFNLILADLCTKNMLYAINRMKEGNNFKITWVEPGIRVLKLLTSARLHSPWSNVEVMPRCT